MVNTLYPIPEKYSIIFTSAVVFPAHGPPVNTIFFISGILDTQFIQHLDQSLVKALVRTDTLAEGHVYHIVITYTHHHVALALLDGLNGTHTSGRGEA